MTENGVGQLEEEALKRKERLKALKRKAKGIDADEDVEAPKAVFRSYKPDNEEIKEQSLEIHAEPTDVEKEVESQLQAMKTPLTVEEIDISNLAPRKLDWDLKRDVAKKLEILERRTQKAIAELIRERMRGSEENLLQAVNVGTAQENQINEGE